MSHSQLSPKSRKEIDQVFKRLNVLQNNRTQEDGNQGDFKLGQVHFAADQNNEPSSNRPAQSTQQVVSQQPLHSSSEIAPSNLSQIPAPRLSGTPQEQKPNENPRLKFEILNPPKFPFPPKALFGRKDFAMLLAQLLMADQLPSLSSHDLSPEEELSNLVSLHKMEQLKQLFSLHPHVNVNAQDPETGRTALHAATECPNPFRSKAIALLLEHKADTRIHDKEGYTAGDLFVHPHAFDSAMILDSEIIQAQFAYIQYFIDKYNVRLQQGTFTINQGKIEPERKGNTAQCLKLVKDVDELLDFINQHPEFEQFGFGILKPASTRPTANGHLSSILYDRNSNTFIQTDSAGFLYLLPKHKTPKDAKYYYFPQHRLVLPAMGCWEDAYSLLYAIFTRYFPGIIQFCRENASKDPENLSPFTKDELLTLQRLSAIEAKKLFPKDKEELSRLSAKVAIEKQVVALRIMQEEPYDEIYPVPGWPLELLHFLQPFNRTRDLLNQKSLAEPEAIQHLERVLQTGVKRFPATSNKDILEYFKQRKPNAVVTEKEKKYDLGGRNNLERTQMWKNLYEQLPAQEYTKILVEMQGFFNKRVAENKNAAPKKYFDPRQHDHPKFKEKAETHNDTRQSIFVKRQNLLIADRIAAFVTGVGPQQHR